MKLFQEFLIGEKDKVEKEINVTGGVILKVDQERIKSVLIIQRSPDDHYPGIWEFPRGRCDKGDKKKLIECLKREVKEETGLDIIVLKYINHYEYIANKGKRKSIQYNYLCKMKTPNQKVKLSKEHSDYRWVQSFGEIELMVPFEMKKTIAQVLNIDEAIVNYSNINQVIEETQKRWIKY